MVTMKFLKNCFELGKELLDKNELTETEQEFLKELDKITIKNDAKTCNIYFIFGDTLSQISAEELKKVKERIAEELNRCDTYD